MQKSLKTAVPIKCPLEAGCRDTQRHIHTHSQSTLLETRLQVGTKEGLDRLFFLIKLLVLEVNFLPVQEVWIFMLQGLHNLRHLNDKAGTACLTTSLAYLRGPLLSDGIKTVLHEPIGDITETMFTLYIVQGQ